MKRYKQLYEKKWLTIRLDEDLQLADLKNYAGLSDFTKPFMLDRKKLKGVKNTS